VFFLEPVIQSFFYNNTCFLGGEVTPLEEEAHTGWEEEAHTG